MRTWYGPNTMIGPGRHLRRRRPPPHFGRREGRAWYRKLFSVGLGVPGSLFNQDGALSPWPTKDQARDSFSPVLLDVFHASTVAAPPRPAHLAHPQGANAKWRPAKRRFGLSSPMGTTVGMEFADGARRSKVVRATAFDYPNPCWRADYPDDD